MDQLDAHSLLCVCSKLRASEILTAGATCTTLASVTRANALWQPLLQQDFGLCLQVVGSQGVDLQSTYKQLATARTSHALRFAAVYTDGGCDGMPDDLTYWADHAFQPNYYSPHCSDGKQDISIVAVLRPEGCDVDVQLSQHRQYLVERCAPAAALLFGPPGVAAVHPTQSIPQAAASLAGWSSVGLERLFMDLYQDLVLHQQQSTWGKLLLRDIPAGQVQQELQRLDEAAQRIEARQGRGLYSAVQQVPAEAVIAAKAAAKAALTAGSSSCSSLFRPPQHGSQLPAPGADAATDSRAVPSTVRLQVSGASSAAATAGSVEHGTATVSSPPPAAAAAAAAPAAAGYMAAIVADSGEMSPKQAARHMFDSRQLEWFGERSSANTTALVREVLVSRVGHFTCPLAAGALLLGQHPGAASQPGSSCNSSSAQLQQALTIKHDPLTAAVNGLTSLEQVLSAVAAGQLPPVLQQGQGLGVQWLEFAPLTAQQRKARAKHGWYLQPVIWFRFCTPPQAPLPPDPPAAAEQQVQEDIVISSDSEQDTDAGADADAAAAEGGQESSQEAILEEESLQQAAQPDGSPASRMEDSMAGEEETSPENGQSESTAHTAGTAESEDEMDSIDGDDEDSASLCSIDAAGGPSRDSRDVDMAVEGQGEGSNAPASAAAGAAGDSDDDVFLDVDVEMAEQPLTAAVQQQHVVQAAQPALVSHQQHQQVQGQQQQQQQYGGSGAAIEPRAACMASADGEQQQQQQPNWCGGSSSGCSSERSAAWRCRGTSAISIAAPPGGLTELVPDDASVPAHLLLRVPLRVVHSGNAALLKLINSENKMDEYDDPAEEPNIDIQCVSLRGLAVQVTANGVTLL